MSERVTRKRSASPKHVDANNALLTLGESGETPAPAGGTPTLPKAHAFGADVRRTCSSR
jgi:hypothetical protein